jgi:hypothetical protein
MKGKRIKKMAVTFGLSGIILLNSCITVMAGTSVKSPAVARTKMWDAIEYSLGGRPESVTKIEYAGSVFYLGFDVTETDFLTVLAAGPEAVLLKPPRDNGMLYDYPVYILWNSDKTVLLVHPIVFDYDKILDEVAIPAEPPESLPDTPPVVEAPPIELTEEQKYMLTDEYTDAVRKEFYKLLNEHRAANGLRELEIDVELQGYADIRADEQRILFGHTRPDGTPAGSGWHNMHNVMNSRYAENALSVGALDPNPVDTALGIFSIWEESKGHNRHMLYDFKPDIKMGFGIVPMDDGEGHVVSGAIFASGY